MPVDIRRTDAAVDPVFCCRACGQKAYDEEENRTLHPGRLTPTPMGWVNAKLDELCYETLQIVFRNTPTTNNTLENLKSVTASEKAHNTFIEQREQITLAMLAADRAGFGAECTGVRVMNDKCCDVIKTRGAYIFYPDKDYPGSKAEGTHVVGKMGSTQGVYVYKLPGDAVQVDIQERFTGCTSNLMASTIGGKELFPYDLAQSFKTVEDLVLDSAKVKETGAKRSTLKNELCADDILVDRISKRVVKGLVKLLGNLGPFNGPSLEDDACTVATVNRRRQKADDIDLDNKIRKTKEGGIGLGFDEEGIDEEDDDDEDDTEMWQLAGDGLRAAASSSIGVKGGKTEKASKTPKVKKGELPPGLNAGNLAKLGEAPKEAGAKPALDTNISKDSLVILKLEDATPERWMPAFSAEFQKNPAAMEPFFERFTRKAPKYYLKLADPFITEFANLVPPEEATDPSYFPDCSETPGGILKLSLSAGAKLYGVATEDLLSLQAQGIGQAVLQRVLKLETAAKLPGGEEKFALSGALNAVLAWVPGAPELQSDSLLQALKAISTVLEESHVTVLTKDMPELVAAMDFFFKEIKLPMTTERERVRSWFNNAATLPTTKGKPFIRLLNRWIEVWCKLQVTSQSIDDLKVYVASLNHIKPGEPLEHVKFSQLVTSYVNLTSIVEPTHIKGALDVIMANRECILTEWRKQLINDKNVPNARAWFGRWKACLMPAQSVTIENCLLLAEALQSLRGFRVTTPAPHSDPDGTWGAFVMSVGTFTAIESFRRCLSVEADAATFDGSEGAWISLKADAAGVQADVDAWLAFLNGQAVTPPGVSSAKDGVTDKDVKEGQLLHAAWVTRVEALKVAKGFIVADLGFDEQGLDKILLEAHLVAKHWGAAYQGTAVSIQDSITILKHILDTPFEYHTGVFDVDKLGSFLEAHVENDWRDFSTMVADTPIDNEEVQSIILNRSGVYCILERLLQRVDKAGVFLNKAEIHSAEVNAVLDQYAKLQVPWWTDAPGWGNIEVATLDCALAVDQSKLMVYLLDNFDAAAQTRIVTDGNQLVTKVDRMLKFTQFWPAYPGNLREEFGCKLTACTSATANYQQMMIVFEQLAVLRTPSDDALHVPNVFTAVKTASVAQAVHCEFWGQLVDMICTKLGIVSTQPSADPDSAMPDAQDVVATAAGAAPQDVVAVAGAAAPQAISSDDMPLATLVSPGSPGKRGSDSPATGGANTGKRQRQNPSAPVPSPKPKPTAAAKNHKRKLL